MNFKFSLVAFAASTAFIASAAAAATPATGNLNVSATVARVCTVATHTLAFGAVGENLVSKDVDITVNCSASTTEADPVISVGNGLHQNRMKHQTLEEYIPYTLTAGAQTSIEDGDFKKTFTGTIPAGTYAVGTFQDTVTITVTYDDAGI